MYHSPCAELTQLGQDLMAAASRLQHCSVAIEDVSVEMEVLSIHAKINEHRRLCTRCDRRSNPRLLAWHRAVLHEVARSEG
jgi:hypothetical protein